MTLISTIIPVYNGEAFLREAIDSVVSQDHPTKEVIVVDDGSSDDSRQIAESYPEVSVIEQDHAGVAAARNSGVAASSGRLLAFLDADDVWVSGKLSMQLRYLTERPEADGVFGLMRNFIQEGVPRPLWLPDHQLDRDVVGHSLCTLLVKREVFDAVGLFDPSIQSGEDGDWFFRAKDAGVRLDMIQDRLLFRRIHSRNLSHDARAVRAGILRAVRSSLKRKESQEDIDAGSSR